MEHARTLALEGVEHRFAIRVKLGTDIGQRKEGTAIDPGLAVHVDNTTARSTQKGVEGLLKLGIPVQDDIARTVGCINADIVARSLGLKPCRAIPRSSTIDDVRDAALIHELRGQKRPGSDENAGVEVGRRLAKVVRHRS